MLVVVCVCVGLKSGVLLDPLYTCITGLGPQNDSMMCVWHVSAGKKGIMTTLKSFKRSVFNHDCRTHL